MEMAEKDSPGQRDQRAAEAKTAEVAAENQRNAEQQRPKTAADVDVAQVVGTDQTPARSDDAPDRQPVDAAVDPFPNYGAQKVEDLEAQAQARGVEINRDPLKAEIIRKLRENDGEAISRGETLKQGGGADRPYASYDVIPLDELLKLAESRGVDLDPGFKTAHLITELRAADTSGGVGVVLNKAK
jgi:hypothetical protein